MNFDEADENDDDELNDVLWRAIRKGVLRRRCGAFSGSRR